MRKPIMHALLQTTGRMAIILALACGALTLATPAQAWEHGRHGWHGGIWWGPGLWIGPPPPYYAYPAYPPAYAYPPPPVIIQQAPVAAPGVWYYCDNPQGYYPYVPACSVGWRQVPAVPPGSIR